jgi:hypothetical protein
LLHVLDVHLTVSASLVQRLKTAPGSRWWQKLAGTVLLAAYPDYAHATCDHNFWTNRDLRMPGVMFPFSQASEEERRAAISAQIGETPIVFCLPLCYFCIVAGAFL